MALLNRIPLGMIDGRYMKSGVWVDVRRYGVLGDGSTDDTAAIQSAINAAKHYSYPNLLFFPKGKYLISAPLVVDRRIDIEGVGAGAQIFQSADANLFEFEPYALGACSGSRIANISLGSAAVAAGTSVIYFHKVGSSVIENVVLRGADYGIYLHGSLHNTIRDLLVQTGGFFEPTSQCRIWIYSGPDGISHSNGNMFWNCTIGYGEYGLYIDETSEGNFHWYGGRIEGGNDYGVYVKGVQSPWSITDLHLEGEAATCGIEIVNCANGRISGKNYGMMSVKRSKRIEIIGGTYRGLNVDKFSTDIIINNTLAGVGGTSVASSETNNAQMMLASSEYERVGGKSTHSVRNLVDGILDAWHGGAPVGFSRKGTGNLIVEEGTIVKFGSKSAKIQVGAAHTNAFLQYTLDLDRYTKLDLTNYRSSAYRWTLSGSGTNEYYVELAAGGDPNISKEPLKIPIATAGGVLINNSWATVGTMGSLAAGEWDYGDNDALGYNTIYVRLSDDTDPDTKASGYVQAQHKWHTITASCYAYKPETNGANPQILLYMDPPGGGIGGAHSIPTEEWTRISRTFVVTSGKTDAYIDIGFYPGSANNICYIDGIEIVDGDAVSPIYDDSRGIDGNFRVGGRFIESAFLTFADGDATPNVAWGKNYFTNNSAPTTITRFDYGCGSQTIFVVFKDANTKVDFSGTNLKGNAGVDWSPGIGDTMRCTFDGTDWWCHVDNTS